MSETETETEADSIEFHMLGDEDVEVRLVSFGVTASISTVLLETGLNANDTGFLKITVYGPDFEELAELFEASAAIIRDALEEGTLVKTEEKEKENNGNES